MSSTINILLLGETGVGKSTWLNSFCNYVCYESLMEAQKAETLQVLIPSAFTVMDDNFEEITVSVGEFSTDENTTSIGQSATQIAKVHTFRTNSTTINIIDTPGIGDSRGIIQDNLNMENIMKTLQPLGHLHGICILLKPNDSRLTLSLRFCIQELLGHLHKDAIKNIVFGFTNTRANFYRPGESLKILRELIATCLPSRSAQNLSLDSNTLFCFDSEAFRYLAAINHGVVIPEDESSSICTSWQKSSKEAERMINHFRSLPVHDLEKTLNLYKVRKTIDVIAKPVVNIGRLIQDKIDKAEELKGKLEAEQESTWNLGKNLFGNNDYLERRPLEEVRVVCAHASCSQPTAEIDGTMRIHYKDVCHSNCTCWASYGNTPPLGIQSESRLLQCSKMAGVDEICCTSCSHPWQDHLFVDYETSIKTTQPLDFGVGGQIVLNVGSMVFKGLGLMDLEQKITSLKAEKCKMEEIATQLTAVLQCNAIDDENDAMGEYIDHLIKQAQEKNPGHEKFQMLLEMKKAYVVKLSCLKNDLPTSPQMEITSGQIDDFVSQLLELPISGEQIKNSLNEKHLS